VRAPDPPTESDPKARVGGDPWPTPQRFFGVFPPPLCSTATPRLSPVGCVPLHRGSTPPRALRSPLRAPPLRSAPSINLSPSVNPPQQETRATGRAPFSCLQRHNNPAKPRPTRVTEDKETLRGRATPQHPSAPLNFFAPPHPLKPASRKGFKKTSKKKQFFFNSLKR